MRPVTGCTASSRDSPKALSRCVGPAQAHQRPDLRPIGQPLERRRLGAQQPGRRALQRRQDDRVEPLLEPGGERARMPRRLGAGRLDECGVRLVPLRLPAGDRGAVRLDVERQALQPHPGGGARAVALQPECRQGARVELTPERDRGLVRDGAVRTGVDLLPIGQVRRRPVDGLHASCRARSRAPAAPRSRSRASPAWSWCRDGSRRPGRRAACRRSSVGLRCRRPPGRRDRTPRSRSPAGATTARPAPRAGRGRDRTARPCRRWGRTPKRCASGRGSGRARAGHLSSWADARAPCRALVITSGRRGGWYSGRAQVSRSSPIVAGNLAITVRACSASTTSSRSMSSASRISRGSPSAVRDQPGAQLLQIGVEQGPVLVRPDARARAAAARRRPARTRPRAPPRSRSWSRSCRSAPGRPARRCVVTVALLGLRLTSLSRGRFGGGGAGSGSAPFGAVFCAGSVLCSENRGQQGDRGRRS